MTRRVNEEFAKWVAEWIAVVQQSRVAPGSIHPEKTAGTEEGKYTADTSVLVNNSSITSDV